MRRRTLQICCFELIISHLSQSLSQFPQHNLLYMLLCYCFQNASATVPVKNSPDCERLFPTTQIISFNSGRI